MHKKHKVKTHHWNNGVLQTLEHWFESIEEATLFSGNVDAHSVKVYNQDGELVHSRQLNVIPEQISPRVSDESYA